MANYGFRVLLLGHSIHGKIGLPLFPVARGDANVSGDFHNSRVVLPVKIAVLTNHLSARGGGIPSAILRLYELLGARGLQTILVASDLPDHAPSAALALYRTLGPKSFGFSPDLLSILDRERPDLVHLHGLWTYGSIAARIWQRRTGNPVVVSPHGMVDGWALRHHAFRKWIAGAAFEWANLRNASRIHALTEGEVKALSNLGFHDHVVKIPNGVDLTKTDEACESSRRSLLYIGRLHPKKGIVETIIAWSLFQKEHAINPACWQLVIAGWDDGGHLHELHKIIESYDLGAHVKFVGPVFGKAKTSLYANADATILASHSEGLPMTVLETWAYGKPVFITEQCNLPEGFRTGAAFKITTNPRNIAEVLIDVLPNRARLNSAGEAARVLAENSFNWEKIAETWLSLYSSLVNPRPEDNCVS
jgi:glycosyltransferase involved in cell wall biosynthesis